MEEKQKEIDRLRRELIARSNAKQLNSKFPTVEEVCTEYRSIKNQEFQTVHSKLTKPLRKKHKEWNKFYVNKLSHKLLFDTLIECYQQTLIYHDHIYSSIGDILQIEYKKEDNDNTSSADVTLNGNKAENKDEDGSDDEDTYEDTYEDEDEVEFDEEEFDRYDSNNALEFLFHRYLTNNYETMKESNEFKEIKNSKILQDIKGEYSEIINDLSSEEQNELIIALKTFISKCCNVCWTMVLQRPKLTISPFEFIPSFKIEFDENKQTRILGSNRKDKHILYYVWPGIAQDNIQLDNIKVYVVQRDEDFPQSKQ